MEKIVSVIPIKLNNERLPNKNIKKLGGKPLISYIQETLLRVPLIQERYVFCSNEEITPFLEPGVTYMKRSAELDGNDTNFTQIFHSFSTHVEADIYVYAHATAPFVKEETVQECIEIVLDGKYDSAFTAVKIQDFLWKNNEPWNFDAANIPRSQDIEPVYRETSGIYVFRKEVFRNYKRRVGVFPYIKEVGYRESVDINTAEDFELAQVLVNSGDGNQQ